MGEGEWFGELRSAAHGEESASGWGRICRALDQMSEAFGREQALPYLDGALVHWSHDARRAPSRWVRAAVDGASSWRLGAARELLFDSLLTRSLENTFEKRGLDEAQLRARFAAVLMSEDTRPCRSLIMDRPWFDSDFDFGSAPVFEGVEQLWFTDNHDMRAVEALLTTPLDALSHLRLPAMLSDDARTWEVLSGLPALRVLKCPLNLSTLREGAGPAMLEGLELLDLMWRGTEDVDPEILPNLRELRVALSTRGAQGRYYGDLYTLEPWLSWGGWEQLESLTVEASYNASNASWRDVDGQPHARENVDALSAVLERAHGLRELRIGIDMRPEDLDAILSWPSMSNLERLDLSGAYTKGKSGKALFSDLCSDKPIEVLELSDCEIKPTLAAKMRYPSSVRRLDLSGKNKLGEKGARQVAQECEGVEVAWLERVGLGAAGGAALAGGVFGQNVRALDVSANKLGAAGLEGLLSRDWPALESLWLGMNGTGNELDADAMRVLADWDGLANLKFLSLVAERMTGEAMEALCESPYLKNLEGLDLSGNTMTAKAAEALAAAQCVPKLRALGIGFTRLVREGWPEIVGADWSALELLYFADDKARMKDVEFFMRNLDRFPALEYLDADQKFSDIMQAYSERADREELGFREDGVFPFMLPSIMFRGISERHAISWREEERIYWRSSWWDAVSR